MAAFVLAAIVHDYPLGQRQCLASHLHRSCSHLLSQSELPSSAGGGEERIPGRFRLWLLIVLAELLKGHDAARLQVYQHGCHLRIYARLADGCSQVRERDIYIEREGGRGGWG